MTFDNPSAGSYNARSPAWIQAAVGMTIPTARGNGPGKASIGTAKIE